MNKQTDGENELSLLIEYWRYFKVRFKWLAKSFLIILLIIALIFIAMELGFDTPFRYITFE